MQQLSNQGNSGLNIALNTASRSPVTGQKNSRTTNSSKIAASKTVGKSSAKASKSTAAKTAKKEARTPAKKAQQKTTSKEIRRAKVGPKVAHDRKAASKRSPAATATPRIAPKDREIRGFDVLPASDSKIASASVKDREIRSSRVAPAKESDVRRPFATTNRRGEKNSEPASNNTASLRGALRRVVDFFKGLFKK